MEPIILIGGGGHCISCIDVIEKGGLYKILGILDLPEKVGQKVLGYPVIGTDSELEKFLRQCSNFLITIGQIESFTLREKKYNEVIAAGGKLPVIISPLAYVSKHAEIEEGTVIMHNVLVNAGAKIGKTCIINTNALIEHEAEVGDFCHVSTSSIANGQVKVGKGCFIGSNTVVGNNTLIADNVVVAAGSQVLRNIELPGIYVGNPLRKIR
jgi:sugar O-acyltransferase (sialic acid O-acetyltransferase NeuD family)